MIRKNNPIEKQKQAVDSIIKIRKKELKKKRKIKKKVYQISNISNIDISNMSNCQIYQMINVTKRRIQQRLLKIIKKWKM